MDIMSILTVVVTVAVLGFLYWRMIRRETPEPIGTFQALFPLALGVVSLFPSAFCGILYMKAMGTAAVNGGAPMGTESFFSSLVNALMIAGLPEEIFKLIMIVIVLAVFRSRIKNVYEYILIGAAVGFGFTIAEEFYYAGEGEVVTFVMRMISVAGHMVFNMIMAEFLGRARFGKLNGQGSPSLQYALALVVPLAIHTLYDACTSFAGSALATPAGMIRGVAAFLGMVVIQIVVLVRFKKKTDAFCGMSVQSAQRAAG